MTSPDPLNQPMTTDYLNAKVELRRAWFAAYPDRPIWQARAEVEELMAYIEAGDAARAAAPSDGLREAAVQLRAAAVKAGAHIVVTNDYPDGVKAFGILCDAIDVMDAALESPTTEQREGLDANG